MQLRCQSEVAGLRTMAPASLPWTAVQGLARDLPETALHVT
jgi:hypothetical protein